MQVRVCCVALSAGVLEKSFIVGISCAARSQTRGSKWLRSTRRCAIALCSWWLMVTLNKRQCGTSSQGSKPLGAVLRGLCLVRATLYYALFRRYLGKLGT